ncbi:GNAT family N-acetyltransferase [Xanthomonas oryzae]|uniref:GNAT family N-acetyltransferase n=1 Tax=Xanthomonas oryzae TaxID=347 RepID=UPI00067F6AFD|nr:hypothetical protein AXO1947_05770 [Xanthomonas oryzae pv. oryzae]KOR44439.1 hypothetical protein ADT26_09710 [Xanthomonas oryzae]
MACPGWTDRGVHPAALARCAPLIGHCPERCHRAIADHHRNVRARRAADSRLGVAVHPLGQRHWIAAAAAFDRHSLCFGGFIGSEQVAFAPMESDDATFAYLGDVFVLPEHQGRGCSKVLMAAVMAHPTLQ